MSYDGFFDGNQMSSSPPPSMGSSPRPRNGGRGGRGRNNNRRKKNNGTNYGGSNQGGERSSRSTSPRPSGNSKSPPRNNYYNHNRHHNQNQNDLHHHYNPKKDGPPDITVVVNRVDLYDSAAHIRAVAVDGPMQPTPPYPVAPYEFDNNQDLTTYHNRKFQDCLVAIQRVPYSVTYVPYDDLQTEQQTVPLPPPPVPPEGHDDELSAATSTDNPCTKSTSVQNVVDNETPNPYDRSIDKYWAQRRRLFLRFDQGIQLDSEGWYSVTPEIIADHVAKRIGALAVAASKSNPNSSGGAGWVVLDAFSGCGGNGIAFSKIPADMISLTVCCDTDRNKLRMAAHNASLYNIPPSQIVFVECNSIFILKHCYRNGIFILDQPELLMESGAAPMQLPNPVATEIHEGYHIGGINILPRRIDMVFMDPPWGGEYLRCFHSFVATKTQSEHSIFPSDVL